MISEEKFREMLSHHDINYVYHDDYSIWLKGKVEKQFIDCVLNDQPELQCVYDEFASKRQIVNRIN